MTLPKKRTAPNGAIEDTTGYKAPGDAYSKRFSDEDLKWLDYDDTVLANAQEQGLLSQVRDLEAIQEIWGEQANGLERNRAYCQQIVDILSPCYGSVTDQDVMSPRGCEYRKDRLYGSYFKAKASLDSIYNQSAIDASRQAQSLDAGSKHYDGGSVQMFRETSYSAPAPDGNVYLDWNGTVVATDVERKYLTWIDNQNRKVADDNKRLVSSLENNSISLRDAYDSFSKIKEFRRKIDKTLIDKLSPAMSAYDPNSMDPRTGGNPFDDKLFVAFHDAKMGADYSDWSETTPANDPNTGIGGDQAVSRRTPVDNEYRETSYYEPIRNVVYLDVNNQVPANNDEEEFLYRIDKSNEMVSTLNKNIEVLASTGQIDPKTHYALRQDLRLLRKRIDEDLYEVLAGAYGESNGSDADTVRGCGQLQNNKLFQAYEAARRTHDEIVEGNVYVPQWFNTNYFDLNFPVPSEISLDGLQSWRGYQIAGGIAQRPEANASYGSEPHTGNASNEDLQQQGENIVSMMGAMATAWNADGGLNSIIPGYQTSSGAQGTAVNGNQPYLAGNQQTMSAESYPRPGEDPRLAKHRQADNDIDNYNGSYAERKFDLKTFLVLLIAPILAFGFCWAVRPLSNALTHPYADKDATITNLAIDVKMNKDNSISVKETWHVDLKSRGEDWHGVYKDFALTGDEEMKNFKAFDNNQDVTDDVESSHEDNGKTMKKIYFKDPIRQGNTIIDLSYDITSISSAIKDGTLLNYIPIDVSNTLPVRQLKVNITWGDKTSDSNWVNVKTSSNSKTVAVANKDKISVLIKNLPKSSAVAIVGIAPKGVTDAEPANLTSAQVKSKTIANNGDRTNPALIIILIVCWLLVVITAPMCVAKWSRGRDYDSITYWRDLPELEPMKAGSIISNGGDGISAGLMSLVNKGAIGVDMAGGLFLKNDGEPLTKTETNLLELLRPGFYNYYGPGNPTIKQLSASLPNVNEGADTTYESKYSSLKSEISSGSRGFYKGLGLPALLTDIGAWLPVIIPFLILIMQDNPIWVLYGGAWAILTFISWYAEKRGHLVSKIVLTVFALASAVFVTSMGVWLGAGFLLHFISKKAKSQDTIITESHMKEYHHIMGLYKYLDETSDFSERDLKDVVLWEWYMAYAAAFGLSRKVAKNLNKALEGMSADTRSRYDRPCFAMGGIGRDEPGFHDYGESFTSDSGFLNMDALSGGLNTSYVDHSSSGSGSSGGGSSSSGGSGGGGMGAF